MQTEWKLFGRNFEVESRRHKLDNVVLQAPCFSFLIFYIATELKITPTFINKLIYCNRNY